MVIQFLYSKDRFSANYLLILRAIEFLSLNFLKVQRNGNILATHLRDVDKNGDGFSNAYIKPWTRCPPFMIGLWLGIQYMEYKQVKNYRDYKLQERSKKIVNDTLQDEQQFMQQQQSLPQHPLIKLREKMLVNKWIMYLFQVIGLGMMLFIILIPRMLQVSNYRAWPQQIHSLYLSSANIFFAIGLYLTILPSLLQVNNLTHFLMDTQFFYFIAKVSFWTYLIHGMVIMQITDRQMTDFYYSINNIAPLYVSMAVISILLGFVGTVIVYMPFCRMVQILMNKVIERKYHKKKAN